MVGFMPEPEVGPKRPELVAGQPPEPEVGPTGPEPEIGPEGQIGRAHV